MTLEDYRDLVEDLCRQFAYEGGALDGNPTITTGGLSVLEHAFRALGWSDPHQLPESRCDEPGCSNRRTCGWPTPGGYRETCGEHMKL